MSISGKKRWSNLEERKHASERGKKQFEDPEARKRNSEAQKIAQNRPEVKQRRSERGKIAWANPEVRQRRLEALNRPEAKKKMSVSQSIYQNRPEVRQRQSERGKKQFEDPEARKRNSEAQKIAQNRPEVKQRNSDTHIKRFKDPDERKKSSETTKKLLEIPYYYERHLIGASCQGFWYGHPTLHPENKNGKTYCVLWNKDLWVRIDAAWDYKSAISGVTRWETPSKRQLSRHHVYWQEKACCEWDKDVRGYYAMIDLNHNKNRPNWYKHYIRGDPNKFVLLTEKEHTMIRGSKKSGKDTIYWVRYFEDLIEKRETEGKPCYLSKEEYEVYKIEQADIIAHYTEIT
jgi:hypothetical protein